VGDDKPLEREILVDAPPETVFAFFTDPAKIRLWLGRQATLEARGGGQVRVEINDTRTILGEFVELVPHRRIVFTWGWIGHDSVPPGSTTVEVTLEPEGHGTRLHITHRHLPNDTERANHAKAWEPALGRLVLAAQHQPAAEF
jgi:uncharacterized protein YndB with AHSA1/START domain